MLLPFMYPLHTKTLLKTPPFIHVFLTLSLKSTFLTIPHTLPHPLPKLFPILPPHLPRLDVCRALIIWAPQHADDAEQDSLGSLYWTPALGGRLISVLVIFWRVQDADAYLARRVDVGMEDLGDEFECRRHERVGGWESHESFETTTWKFHYIG